MIKCNKILGKDSPLNLAHAEGRKAERYKRNQNLSEAVKCHQIAIGLLENVCELTSDTRALQSVKLQQEYHSRQVALLQHRLAHQPVPTSNEGSKDSTGPFELRLGGECEDSRESSDEVFTGTPEALQTIEDCDSLLHMLNKRAQLALEKLNTTNPATGSSGQDSARENKQTPLYISGIKRAKHSDSVLEELCVQNEELRRHVMRLLEENQQQTMQITTLAADNARLRRAQHDSGTDVDILQEDASLSALLADAAASPPVTAHSGNPPAAGKAASHGKSREHSMTSPRQHAEPEVCHESLQMALKECEHAQSGVHNLTEEEEEKEEGHAMGGSTEIPPLEIPQFDYGDPGIN